MAVVILLIAIVWAPVILHEVGRRRFAVLMVWLFLAPFSTLALKAAFGGGGSLVVVGGPTHEEPSGYLGDEASVSLRELLEPTRLLFAAYMLLLLNGYIWRQRRWVPLDRTEVYMVLFAGVLLASVVISSNRLLFGLRMATDAFIVPFMGYFIARRVMTREDQLNRYTHVVGYVGCLVILACLVERLTHGELLYRLKGPFESSQGLGTLMAVFFFVTLAVQQTKAGFATNGMSCLRLSHIFVLSLSPLVVFLTWSRGNWLGFIGGVVMFLMLRHRIVHVRKQVFMLGVLLLSLSVLVVVFEWFHTTRAFEARVANVSNVYARIGAWQIAVEESLEKPVFGIGLNNLRDVLADRRFVYQDVKNEGTSHNSFLSLLGELGIAGLTLYLGVVWSLFKLGVALNREVGSLTARCWGLAVIAILITYMLPALFANTLYLVDPSHAYLYVLMGAIAGVYRRPMSRSFGERSSYCLTQSAVA